MKLCLCCRVEMDQPGRPDTNDCGGDCVRCMAGSLDDDCMKIMRGVEPDNPRWQDEGEDHGG